MSNDAGFSEAELKEAEVLAEQDEERRKPPKKNPLKYFMNPAKFEEDQQINPLNLDEMFMTQAGHFAYYGTLSAKANKQASNMKMMMEIKEAELAREHRDNLNDTHAKVTEAMINSAVITDPRYKRITMLYHEAVEISENLKTVVEAFRQRRDMLVQMGAMQREELKGDLVMKSKEARESDLRERVRRIPDKASA